jgi:hypothetical protein
MTLEDYVPYKALNLPLGLFGPAPRMPRSCICGRFIVEDYCACASSCWGTSKHAWAKANPELYEAEQEGERIAMRRHQFWIHQRGQVEEKIWIASKSVVQEFQRLQDQESAIGCHSCEQNGRTYCRCACDSCGSKYCYSGECSEEMDYV